MPVEAEYLWTHGRACLRWARECFDVSTASRLRKMGEDLLATAAEIDAEAVVFNRDADVRGAARKRAAR